MKEMSKEEQAVQLDKLSRAIKDFKVRCNIPWGDYTPYEREDIDECISRCAVFFYNFGVSAERQALMDEMNKIQEKQNSEAFLEMLGSGVIITEDESVPFKEIIDRFKKDGQAR